MLAMLLLLIDSEEDQRKFEELYHRYKQLMFHVSRDYFHTESAVEDAVQEAFIRIIKNFSKIGEINCPQTKHFIVIVVRSTCIDLLRTGKGEGVAIPWEDVPEVEAPENLQAGCKIRRERSVWPACGCASLSSTDLPGCDDLTAFTKIAARSNFQHYGFFR